MADEFQLLELPLAGGLNEKTDNRKSGPTSLLTAINVVRTKDGAYGKRFGTKSLSSALNGSGSLATPATLAIHGDELLVLEAGRLLSRSDAIDRLTPIDNLPELVAGVGKSVVHFTGNGTLNGTFDFAWNSSGGATNFACYAWAETDPATNNSAIFAIVIDGTTNAVAIQRTELADGSGGGSRNPRVIAIGATFVVGYITGNPASGSRLVRVRTVDLTVLPLAWSVETTLRSDVALSTDGNLSYDIALVDGTTTDFALVYADDTAPRINIFRYRLPAYTIIASGVGSSLDSKILAVAIRPVAGDAANTAVAWIFDDTNDIVRFSWFNGNTLIEVGGPIVVATHGTTDALMNLSLLQITTGTNCLVAWSSTRSEVRTRHVNSTPALVGTERVLYRAALRSKPALVAGRVVAVVGIFRNRATTMLSTDIWERSWAVVDLNGDNTSTAGLVPRPLVSLFPRTAGLDSAFPTAEWLANIAVAADGPHVLILRGLTSQVVGSASANAPQLALWDVPLLTDMTKRQVVEIGGLTCLSGGVPCWFDGSRVAELGFFYTPYVTVISDAGGGSLEATKTYRYGVIFVQYDAAGNVHRSAPYYISRVLGGADNRVVLTISFLNLTARQDPTNNQDKPYLELYRSKGNATGTLYRLTAALPATTSLNDPTATELIYTDGAADTALDGAPFIYTQGGALPNVNPPSARLAAVHRGRLWLAGCADGRELWASKKLVSGEPPTFTDGFVFYVEGGAEITALASMDDKLVVFKSDRVFYIAGDGPDDSGKRYDWSDPIPIVSPVGCTDARGIARISQGLVFRSRAGLSLLSRNLEVVPHFGAPVEDTLTSFPIVTIANAAPDRTEMRFPIANAALSAGREIRYDYRTGEWFTANYSHAGSFGQLLQSAVVSRNIYYWITRAGNLYQEDTATYLDAGSTYVPMTIETAPISQGGTLGYQDVAEVQLLIDRLTAIDLTLEIAADGDTYAESKTWNQATLAAHPTEDPLSLKLRRAAKSRRTKIRVSDATPSSGVVGTGQGFSLIAAAFKVSIKEGPYKLLSAGQKG